MVGIEKGAANIRYLDGGIWFRLAQMLCQDVGSIPTTSTWYNGIAQRDLASATGNAGIRKRMLLIVPNFMGWGYESNNPVKVPRTPVIQICHLTGVKMYRIGYG